jgi:hypothetical protein
MAHIEKPIDARRESDDRKAKPVPDGAGDEAVAGGERAPGGGVRPEPISYIGTCATEAMWDAVLGGSPAAICRYCKVDRQQDAGCGQEGTRRAEQCLRPWA